MKATGIGLIAFAVLICIIMGIYDGLVSYHFNQRIGDYWTLSIKASTLQQKSAYLDKYISGLTEGELGDNDAIVFKTPDNSSVQNLVALQSLQERMHVAMKMDENSMAYQTAMQQITAQEQDENHKVIETLEQCWLKANRPIIWWGGTIFLCMLALAAIGGLLIGILD